MKVIMNKDPGLWRNSATTAKKCAIGFSDAGF
jgi:hypothetical protein